MPEINLGTLYVISTPIGNLEDITSRALDILKTVDYILCEDTRVTKRLLLKYNIDSKLISFNEENEHNRISKVIDDLNNNFKIGLVSDAGTPCISDPGYRLVSNIKKNNLDFNVLPLPGPSAAIAALSVSGLPSDCFYFVGFLPKKKGRQKKLKQIKEIDSSIILYEAPYRINKTLSDLYTCLGDRKIFIAREMTKIYEQHYYGTIKSMIDQNIHVNPKGEYVIIIAKEGYLVE
tara:strand:+ start:93 stop:794 length:702 start_codon:yes stop_codon:yes gene_type:complete